MGRKKPQQQRGFIQHMLGRALILIFASNIHQVCMFAQDLKVKNINNFKIRLIAHLQRGQYNTYARTVGRLC